MSRHPPSSSFHDAAAYLSSSASPGTSNAVKLELYGLFKYVTADRHPTASKPSIFDMTGRAKWEAWASAGKKYERVEDAEARYIALAKELGWVEGKVAQPREPPKVPSSTDEDGIWDDENDASGSGEGRGLGLSVSSMARPPPGHDSSIHGVILEGDAVKLRRVLEENPNIDLNQLDEYGYTPLHLACDRGHLEIAQILLAKGADLTIKDPDEFTPLELAQVAGKEDIVALLSSAR